RRAEAEHLARRLASDPPRLAPALRRTRHGVEWMIGRWEALAEAADRGGWDDERFSLAHDLLGLPEELRDVWPELPSGAPAEVQAEVAAAQLARLRSHLEGALIGADARERQLVLIGFPAHDDAASRALMRAEAASRRDLHRALLELHRTQAECPDGAAPSGVPPAPPEPDERPDSPRPAGPPRAQSGSDAPEPPGAGLADGTNWAVGERAHYSRISSPGVGLADGTNWAPVGEPVAVAP